MIWTIDDIMNDTVYYSVYAQITGPNGEEIKTSAGYVNKY